MAPTSRLFVVIRTYGPPHDASKPLDAQAEWEEHRDFMNQLDAEGMARLAGPLGASGEVLLVMRARTAREIEDRLAADPWTRSGILATKRIEEWHLRHGEVR